MRIVCFLVGALALTAQAETFTLTMKEAVDRGLTRNPDITLAKLDELKATQGIRLAQDPFYPHAGIGTGMAYTNGMPLSIDGSAPSILQGRISEYILNRPQTYAVRQQREAVKSTGFATAQKRDEIAFQIAGLYLDADRANRLIETARNQIGSFQKVLDTVQARVDGGRELPIDVHQAQYNMTAARVRLSNLEADRDMAERSLAIALGYTVNDLVVPAAADRKPGDLPKDEAAALQEALAASPEVKRLQSAMIAKGLEIKGTEAKKYPQIDLVAQYALFGKYNGINKYFAQYQPNNGEIGVSIQMPLFIGTSIKTATAQLDTDAQHLKIELQSAKEKIAMSVHQSYSGIDRARLASDLAKEGLDLARDQLTLALYQLSDGRTTLREVEQARINESEKWIAFYDAQFGVERARLELLRQTGTLVASLQ